MKLQIQNKQGTIEVIGNFTTLNTEKVKDHFNYLLDHYEEVVMCLKKVKKIDHSALNVLKAIHKKACKRSKVLFVLGQNNETVFDAFSNHQLTHIFRDDY